MVFGSIDWSSRGECEFKRSFRMPASAPKAVISVCAVSSWLGFHLGLVWAMIYRV